MKKGEMAATEGCILREWQKNCIPAVNEAAALQFVRVLLGLLSPSTPSSPMAPRNGEQSALDKVFAWVFLDDSPHGCLSALLELATSRRFLLAALFRTWAPCLF